MDEITNSNETDQNIMFVDNDQFKSEYSKEESSVKVELSSEFDNLRHDIAQFKSECSEDETSVKVVFENLRDENKIRKICCQEPGCNEKYKTIKNFRDHLQKVHMFDMSFEMMSFPSMTEFMKWKDNYEQENCCFFIKKTGSRSTPNIKQSYLYCNRSGFSETKNKSPRKSMKSGVACTASIIYRELSLGEISVTLHPKHYGHEVQSSIMKVLKLEQQDCAEEEHTNDITNQIRTSSGDEINSAPTRLSKLMKKDIKKKLHESVYGIPSKCLDNSYPSLDAWCVDLMRLPSPAVIYYKPLGYKSDSLSSYDLCLVLMTNHMRNIIANFGDKLVYATTLPIPKVNYHATVLFVLDEFHSPFPAVIMLSNKINNVYLKVLFEVLFANLKTHQISLQTKVFMTDRNDVVFKCWNETMRTKSQHMMCPRYIDGEWRRYLATVSNEELQDEVYDQLCELLEPRDGNVQELLDKVIEKLEGNSKCAKFLVYFKKYYTDCFDQWGGHSLKNILNLHSSPNFEKTVSEIQETLDGKYKKYAKNIVKVLQTLFRRVFSYLYNRASNTRAVITSVDKFHRESMSIDLKQAYRTENENEWQVVDVNMENTALKETVRKSVAVPKCSLSEEWGCSITCSQCEICIHEYSCTCYVYNAQITICLHIHLVVRLIRHSLLSNALEKSNAALKSTDSDPLPQDLETETIKSEQDTEQEPEDETSIRKAIIQSLYNTHDKLYLIQDKCKLKVLLGIAKDLHSLTCQMQKKSQEKQVKCVKSPIMKQMVKKNSNRDINNENIVDETKENKEGIAGGKQLRLLAKKHGLQIKPREIKKPGKNISVVPIIDATAVNENMGNAVVVPTDLETLNIPGENNTLAPSNSAIIHVSKENLVTVPTELGAINKNAFVPSESSKVNVARENVIVPSQNIENYLKENKNSEKKLQEGTLWLAPANIDIGANVKPRNAVIVDNSRIGFIPKVESVSNSRVVSVPKSSQEFVPKSSVESEPTFRTVYVPHSPVSKLTLESISSLKSVPNSVENVKTNFDLTKSIEKEQLKATKQSSLVVNTNRLQIVQGDKTNYCQTNPDEIKSSKVIVTPKKPQIKIQQELVSNSAVETNRIPAKPTTSHCIDKTSASTITSWNIEISWQKKKILIPLFNDPKIEIEKIIQKLFAGHFVYKNEKDKRGDIISSHKSSIIEQLTDILTSLQNPGRSVSPSKPNSLVTVKLLERQEPLTLKRKIEEFSHQVHTQKHNDVLVVNEANKREPTNESIPKKLKPNEQVLNSARQTVLLENNAKKNTCEAKKTIHVSNVNKTEKELAPVKDASDVNKEVPKEVTPTEIPLNVHKTVQKELCPTIITPNVHKTVLKKVTPVETSKPSEVEASPAKIPRIETEATTSADLSQENAKNSVQQKLKVRSKQEIKDPNQQELDYLDQQKRNASIEEKLQVPNQQKLEVPIDQDADTPILQKVQQPIREDLSQQIVKGPHQQKLIQEEIEDDTIEQDMQSPVDEKSEAITERPIPKRVVRTLRPQMQNKFNSPPKKGVLKVLKPCIRGLTKSSEV